jgi:hypothetical protein
MEISLHALLLIALGIIGWFARNTLFEIKDSLKETNKELNSHVDECNKIPKSLIIERIDNFCDRLDTQHTEIKEMRSDFKEEVKYQHQQHVDLNDTIKDLVVKTKR